jgi:hypothetical protein
MLSKVRLTLDAVVLILFAWALSQALGFPRLAAQFPMLVAVGGLAFGAVGLARDIKKFRSSGTALGGDVMDTASLSAMVGEDSEAGLADAFLALGRYAAWIVGYVATVWLLGMVAASALFVGVFLAIEARLGILRSAIAAAAVAAGLVFLSDLLSAPWPHTVWS